MSVVRSRELGLYVKFRADVVAAFTLTALKEK